VVGASSAPDDGGRNPQPVPLLSPGLADRFEPVLGGLQPHFGASSTDKVEARVVLPARASASLHIEDAATGAGVDVSLQDARDVVPQDDRWVMPSIAHAHVSRDGVAPGAADRNRGFLSFEERPATSAVAYRIARREGISGLRLVANTLEMLDADGAPRLRVAPPYSWRRQRRTDATLAVEGCAVDENRPRRGTGR